MAGSLPDDFFTRKSIIGAAWGAGSILQPDFPDSAD